MKRKPKILIIEDTEINHQLYRDAFENAGFDVTILARVDVDFYEAVMATAPDIISMDLVIGDDEHDGFEAMRDLKLYPKTKKIPVIVLTSFSEESKVLRAKELGAVDYISTMGQPIQKIPNHYLRYLKDPKHYKSSHPLFRKV